MSSFVLKEITELVRRQTLSMLVIFNLRVWKHLLWHRALGGLTMCVCAVLLKSRYHSPCPPLPHTLPLPLLALVSITSPLHWKLLLSIPKALLFPKCRKSQSLWGLVNRIDLPSQVPENHLYALRNVPFYYCLNVFLCHGEGLSSCFCFQQLWVQLLWNPLLGVSVSPRLSLAIGLGCSACPAQSDLYKNWRL